MNKEQEKYRLGDPPMSIPFNEGRKALVPKKEHQELIKRLYGFKDRQYGWWCFAKKDLNDLEPFKVRLTGVELSLLTDFHCVFRKDLFEKKESFCFECINEKNRKNYCFL